MRDEKKIVIAVIREEQQSEDSQDSSHHNSTQVASEAISDDVSVEMERLELPHEEREEEYQLKATIRGLKQVIEK